MKKGIYLLCAICIPALFVVFAYSSGPDGAGQNPRDASTARADLITIDRLSAFGPLEKTPVQFLHDAHTQAMDDKNRDCSTCHPVGNGRLSLKFKRTRDAGKTAVMNLYHQECISCHGQMRLAHEKTGPVECDGCHAAGNRFSPALQPAGFDKSLHYRHSLSQENKCGQCHHAYDQKNRKLYYAKGGEENCRYCHKPQEKENVRSMRSASHQACIDCHRQLRGKNLNAGPVECAGCHDAVVQAGIQKLPSVPRMPGKQPDVVLLKSARAGGPAGTPNSMSFVAFDHRAHEAYNQTCRVCHHESLKACRECHTLDGQKQGGGVNLEKAMHKLESPTSCRGCHLERQKNKNCAGCHSPKAKSPADPQNSCSPCHLRPPAGKNTPSGAEQERMFAAQVLNSRTPVAAYHLEEIPETVVIKDLSHLYEPVAFPHRRIVQALAAGAKESKLAAYFHNQPGTMCQGCHHNSPATRNPPRCASCHGRPFDAENPLKPGTVGAYHLQCMGCHQAMGIQRPAGCTDCHKKNLEKR